MAINIASAVGAYARQAKAAEAPGMAARQDPAQDFGSLVENGLKSAVDVGHNAEKLSAAAIAGKAELADVVTAVNNADVTLQTVIAIRDRVIQAYQDIVRMPI
ncbi:MAG: flagellar hook-basal body complex protein FliE [Rhodospirillales bacterium]